MNPWGEGGEMRIALVGAELEENLALRYIDASLRKAGHTPEIFDFHAPRQIAGLAPAFQGHLNSYSDFLGDRAVRQHVAVYCRGLMSDLPRKSVEPIALAAGSCVRSLQLLLWPRRGTRPPGCSGSIAAARGRSRTAW